MPKQTVDFRDDVPLIRKYLAARVASQADVAQGWKRILGTVRSYADLEPALLGRVEELIDFVTAEPEG